MRAGEVNGLHWRYVDIDRRLILVRETLVQGRVGYTKTAFQAFGITNVPSAVCRPLNSVSFCACDLCATVSLDSGDCAQVQRLV
jgi:hypothetical protein